MHERVIWEGLRSTEYVYRYSVPRSLLEMFDGLSKCIIIAEAEDGWPLHLVFRISEEL